MNEKVTEIDKCTNCFKMDAYLKMAYYDDLNMNLCRSCQKLAKILYKLLNMSSQCGGINEK